MTAFLGVFVVRATVVLLVAAVTIHLFARHAAALRHAVWTGTVLSVAVLLAGPLFPRWEVLPAFIVPAPFSLLRASAGGAARVELVLGAVWLTGTAVLLLRLAAGVRGLARLRRDGIAAPPLLDVCARQVTARLGVPHRATVLLSSVPSPSCWGIRRPMVLLPFDALSWSAEHLQHVLSHECAHLSRHDPAWRLLRQVVCALCWFHPIIWRAARLADDAAEIAADDAVLRSGVSASAYARSLVASAAAPALRLSLSFASLHPIAGRIRAILHPMRSRTQPPRARLWAGAITPLVLAAALGCLAPHTTGRCTAVKPTLAVAKPRTGAQLTAPAAAARASRPVPTN